MIMKPPCHFIDQDCQHEEASSATLSLKKSDTNTGTSCSGFGSSSDDSSSVLSSPVESELGSTTTEESDESSEEEYMAELSRQMAHYMLQDDQDHHHHHGKASWTNSSPAFWHHQRSPKCRYIQALIDGQIRAIQQSHHYCKLNLTQDQFTKQYQNKKKANPTRAGSKSSSSSSSCGGTGVFLPERNAQHASHSRKKQGCSTVRIPARVLHALSQHFDRVVVPSRFNANLLLQYEANSSFNSRQQRPVPATATASSSAPQEIALPQEWTY